MKINGNKQLTDLEGHPMLIEEPERDTKGDLVYADGKPKTRLVPFKLYRAMRTALSADVEQNESGERRFKRWNLANKVIDGEFELTVEEAGLIKECAAKAAALVTYGRIVEAIEKA